ncbi:hypothetical protein MU1_22570 [Paenibacillus glycanilyticus]|uniref:VanZ-like domain-containing protein n=2 Tax=Paenibacillus glycanilyticus TaxID=126569 RepID=A0ABQ6GFT6_9BACL|nr:hypothetical protein MU1_22570 [Paenibacillus glycanilyticus]
MQFAGRMYNLYPFRTISTYFIDREHYNLDILIKNLLGNVVMLAPLGFLMPVMFKIYRRTFHFFTFIFILNLSIEILQIALKLGSFDVDDLILNCTGAMMAYGLTRLLLTAFIKKEREV